MPPSTLKALGHEVVTAHDSNTALETASSYQPEVVLLDIGLPGAGGHDLTLALVYDTVIHMEEVLTIRLPKGTRRRLERRAQAQKLSVSQLVRRALEQDELLTSLASARTELLLQARAQGIYTDEDVFAIVS
jgi:CheY-like chemotaxis protein